MNRNELIESASMLGPFNQEAVLEYTEKIDRLVVIMNETMASRPDVNELIGDNNLSMMKDNHANHARFIASVMQNFNSEVLVDTILWVFRAYRSRSFHSSYWAAQLNTWMTIFEKEFTRETYDEVRRLYRWMQVNIPSFVICSDEKLSENKSMHLTD